MPTKRHPHHLRLAGLPRPRAADGPRCSSSGSGGGRDHDRQDQPPEFGAGSQTFNMVFGATLNPYDPSKTCGGSSGGAAAAVACGMLPFADGGDLAASLRNPGNLLQRRRLPAHARPRAVMAGAERLEHARRAGPHRAHRRGLRVPALGDGRARSARADCRSPSRARFSLVRSTGASRKCASPGAATSAACRWIRASRAVLEKQRKVFTALGCIVEEAEPDFSGADRSFRDAARGGLRAEATARW